MPFALAAFPPIADLLQYIPMLYGFAPGVHLKMSTPATPRSCGSSLSRLMKWTCAQT